MSLVLLAATFLLLHPPHSLFEDLTDSNAPQSHSGIVLKPLEWSVELVSAVCRLARKFLHLRPDVITYADGVSCCVQLICLILLSMPSVSYWVKFQHAELRLTCQDLGDSTYRSCVWAMRDADLTIIRLRCVKGCRVYILESHSLARAIVDFFDDPSQEFVRPLSHLHPHVGPAVPA